MASQSGTVNHDGNNVPSQAVFVPSSTVGSYPAGTGVTNALGGTAVLDANNNEAAAAIVQLGDKTNPQQVAAVNALGQLTTTLGAGVVPAIVQKAAAKSTGSVASLAAPFTATNSAGNSIVVVIGIGNNTAPTIADTAGNTYTQAVLGANSTTFAASIFYATNILAQAANVVTVTNAGTTASMAVEIYEVSGLITQTPSALDQQSAGNATSGTATTSILSPGGVNEIAFAGVAVGTAAQTITPAAGWTNDSGQQNPTTPAGLFSFVAMSQSLTSLAPVTPKATFTSEPWAMAAATFRPISLGAEVLAVDAGWNFTNITAAATTQIKTGPGVLHLVSVNTLVGSATIELDDALSHTTPKIGTITLPGTITAALPLNLFYDINFATGLSITTSGATDITVAWR